MDRINQNLAKDKRVRFSTVGDCDKEHKTSSFPIASEPRKCRFNNELNNIIMKNTSTVNKSVVRNVEEGISSHKVHLDRRKNIKSKCLDTCQLSVQTETTYRSKFEAPELYSSLCIAKAIRVIANTSTTSCAEYEHLGKDARKAMKDKILLKLNIPLKEKLYKDLVPVKVDDAELICKHPPRREMPSTYCKDVEPQLSDFCKPLSGKEFCMWTKPVLHYGERLKYYNGFSLCKSFQIWQA